ncbi:alpha-tocopherol transfer protein-like isoform X1 [Hyposmocoma kahamanoa]|uniref:alpha-tocopherol transfer protein-like isoform X1 n=1 Tax=Hyposmocoma kahamanoa TaxID=1477025 RepID=UPI000E6D87FB|nr:alpha-tocopherol transfer protein-like isoform X1 [Hyposmocoma kahamanoa]XP_026326963.1 alpha-tocopherol transfer protein-like isoform X1 [Hyposmocoma kahamanoa]XP_026326971.1 alpha-tocopherol transfer protein-like isoform X1 [Hyposmocoma kahamanoa]
MPVAVRPLPADLADKAKEELFEDPKKLEDSIQHLKEWIAKQPHLKARTEDQWLAAFLRGTKFSLERAKEKLDLYYSLRTLIPEFQSINHRHSKFMEILKLGTLLILPKSKNLTDPRVLIFRVAACPPGQFTMPENMSVIRTLQKIMYMDDDIFTVNGVVNVVDMKDATLSHFTHLTPLMMKKMVVANQDASPTRMKAAHYYHMPPPVETIFNLIKTFLNEKNRNRLHVHGKDFKPLYKYVSKDILPVEYGGNGGTIEEIVDYWVKKIEEYSKWLDEEERYGTDESKRPGKPKTSEDMFGVEGSFRQLQMD